MRDCKPCDLDRENILETENQRSRTHCETDANYSGVLVVSGKHRISICGQNIQWLFQRKRPIKQGAGERWDNIGYCHSQKGLMRLQRSENAQLEGFIKTLPVSFLAEKV